MKLRNKFMLAALAFLPVVSCVEDFEIKVAKESSTRLVVDCLLTTELSEHTTNNIVRLTTSEPYSSTSRTEVENATVILSDGERTLHLEPLSGSGEYVTPKDFRGEAGRTYTLEVDAELDGEPVHCKSSATMPPSGIRADAMDYYKMSDSLWVFALWGQDEPGIISHYGGELVVHDVRQPYNKWVFIDGSDMFDGNYLWGGEYLFYSTSSLMVPEGQEPNAPLVEGDVVTLYFYSMEDFFYEWFMSMSTETMAHFPMFSPQPANLPSNIEGDGIGVFGLANVTKLSVTIGDPDRTHEQMIMDHLKTMPAICEE